MNKFYSRKKEPGNSVHTVVIGLYALKLKTMIILPGERYINYQNSEVFKKDNLKLND